MTGLVSIGIPVYNCERWLECAIESALAQTWPETELIVVDDGSTDGSAAIARRFQDRIKLVEGGHRGGNAARNIIAREARGELIQFLDADDHLLPDKIRVQISEAGNLDLCDVLISPVIVERTTDGAGDRTLTRIDTGLDVFSQWILWQLPQTGGALWRRSALLDLGGWKEDQPCCQEHELYLRAIQAGLRFRQCPTAAAVHRQWSTDTVSSRDPRRVVHEKTALLDSLRDWMVATGRWTPQHQAIAGETCFAMARTLARFDMDEAAKYHADRLERGLIRTGGDAAPAMYRAAYDLLGFRKAEQLARLARNFR